MAHWPTRHGYARVVNQLRTTSNYSFVSVGTTGTNTKGSWTELIASTPNDAQQLYVIAKNVVTSTVDTGQLLDIGIGAAGSEKVIVPDLSSGFSFQAFTTNNNNIPAWWRIPIYIPAGSRLAARQQSSSSGDTVDVSVELWGGLPPGGFVDGSGVDTFGANSGTSKGVGLTAGASAGLKGTWTEIEDSTPNAIKSLLLSPCLMSGTISTAAQALIDIGVGGLTQEKIVLPDTVVNITSTEALAMLDHGVFPLDTPIPAGSRIVARIASTEGLDTDIGIIVHGVRG
jgi:hypothetical protein